jgi:hypothetical protein
VRRGAGLVAAIFPLAYYLMLARMRIHFPGYLSAIMPQIAVFAALGILATAGALSGVLRRGRRAVVPLALLLCLPMIHDLARAWTNARRYTRPDTRVLLRDHVLEENALPPERPEFIPDGAIFATESWLPLPLTAECLEKMLEQFDLQGDREALEAIPLPERRPSGKLTRKHLEVQLAAAREAPSRARFDLFQLPGAHMSVESLPIMRDLGIRFVVITENRWQPLLDNPALEDPEWIAAHPLYERLAAFYRRLLAGDLVRRRFPAPGESASGPTLVLCDLALLPEGG